MRILRWILIAVMVILFGMSGVTPVWACSGPPTPFASLMNHSDFLIKARVVESDSVGQNHILRVEASYVGGALPEYILLSQNRVSAIAGLLTGSYGQGDCNAMMKSPPADAPFYMLIKQRADGSYDQVGGFFSQAFFTFPEADSTVMVYEEIEEEVYRGIEVTETEFLALAAELSGDSPAEPLTDRFYPFKAPLMLTTTSGTRYIFPVDGGDPVEVTSENQDVLIRVLTSGAMPFLLESNLDGISCRSEGVKCHYFTPDGHTLFRTINDEAPTVFSPYGVPLGTGDAALAASPYVVAVWDQNMLNIYTPLSFLERQTPIAQTQLDGGPLRGYGAAAWTPDGHTLYYSDDNGYWRWQVREDEPQHLTAVALAEGQHNIFSTITGVSPLGNYIHIRERDFRYVVPVRSLTGDARDLETLPNGIFSPDEQIMVVLKFTDYLGLFDISLLRLNPYQEASLTLDQPGYARQVVWINNESFQAVICTDETDASCAVWLFSIDFDQPIIQHTRRIQPGYLIAVSAFGDVAVMVDEDTLSLNGQEIPLELDAAVDTIHWLPALFYTE